MEDDDQTVSDINKNKSIDKYRTNKYPKPQELHPEASAEEVIKSWASHLKGTMHVCT